MHRLDNLPLEILFLIFDLFVVDRSDCGDRPLASRQFRCADNHFTAIHETRITIMPGEPQLNRKYRRYIEQGIDVTQLSGVRLVSREIRNSVDAWFSKRPLRPLRFHLIFQTMTEMSHFLRNLSPLGRARISSIRGYWDRGLPGPPLVNQGAHSAPYTAPYIFDMIMHECTNLSFFMLSVDLADLRRQASRSGISGGYAEVPGICELRELRGVVAARANSYVDVVERNQITAFVELMRHDQASGG